MLLLWMQDVSLGKGLGQMPAQSEEFLYSLLPKKDDADEETRECER
jgi:hypothetical protein